MIYQNFTEKDWKLFRKKIGDWQDAYMDRLNKEYIELLNGDGSPSEKFWKLEERIRKDQKSVGVLVEMRRSVLIQNMISLLNDGVIGFEDLEGFSDELKETVKFIAERLQ